MINNFDLLNFKQNYNVFQQFTIIFYFMCKYYNYSYYSESIEIELFNYFEKKHFH